MLNNINRVHKHCLSIILMLLMLVPLLTGFDIVREVTVRYDGQTKVVKTNTLNPDEILKKAGVKLESGDGWRFVQSDNNVRGSVLEVVRGISFVVIKDNEEKIYKSSKATVGEALKNLGIIYKKNKIYPDPDTALQKDMKVYVLNRNEKLHFSEADIEPDVKYEEDFGLSFGREVVKDEGKAGKLTVVSKVAKDSRGNTITQEIDSKVTKKPESKIIVRGISQSVKTPEGYKRYKKKMVVESSAYTIHCGSGTGLTSIGLVPYEGIVAVDPRVIPYYTKMYIPGYGIAMAGDTGGAIVGNKIDVFMNDWHKAIQWGRRHVEIYILED